VVVFRRFYGGFTVIVWWFCGCFMVLLWLFYGCFFCRGGLFYRCLCLFFSGGFMVIL